MKERSCNVKTCPLRRLGGKLSRPVWGVGPSSCVCMLIGEAPGAQEDRFGIPFVGKSGEELDMYLRRFTRINREDCYVTNIVKCRPPANRDPHVDEIGSCIGSHLWGEIEGIRPSIIGTVGRVSTQWAMNSKVAMEKVHGIPQIGNWGKLSPMADFTIVPLYHPAFGLHSPRRMKDCCEDFAALGRVIRGELRPIVDNIKEDYALDNSD